MRSDNFEIRELPLSVGYNRRQFAQLMESASLKADEELDFWLGVYDSDDNLIGGGGACGDTIKCVALDEALRGTGMSAALVSRLRAMVMEQGHDNVFVYTKPDTAPMFESMAFRRVGASPTAVMLEASPRGLASYEIYLRSLAKEGRNGVVVMNCNPFTLGHLYLIETAAKEVDNLYVIPVSEDRSEYDASSRVEMIRRATKEMVNVEVVDGSPYTISSKTFPTYFIKKVEDATDSHILLDLNVFSRHIAPALHAEVRFVGSEPTDELTARYNELMAATLPKQDIEVRVIARAEEQGTPISASAVRRFTKGGNVRRALSLVPPTTMPYVLAKGALRALRLELDLTPKPGLVDLRDSGSHTDMDHPLMLRSIESLERGFIAMGFEALGSAQVASLQKIGVDTEQTMLEATGGVNTHRGAIFSLGMTLYSFLKAFAQTGRMPDAETLSRAIATNAREITRIEGSHGSEAKKNYNVKGALDNALDGYECVFSDFLPYYRKSGRDCHKTLLHIMTRLDDTNVLHRADDVTLNRVKTRAAELLNDFSLEGLAALNSEFRASNISPGGAADMLALTLFTESITNTEN